jgi:hypothetical protein
VIDDFQALSCKAVDFFVIVNDVTQAIKIPLLVQDFFGHFYGIDHTEAKA